MQSDRSVSQLLLHPNPHPRDVRETVAPPASRGGFAVRAGRRLTAPPHRVTPCPVCRCTSVRLDEVDAGTALHLAECPRCAHRWTSRAPIARTAQQPRGRVAFVHATKSGTAESSAAAQA